MATVTKETKQKYRKISNQHLMRQLLSNPAEGGFTAIVRLAEPTYRPDYMEILGPFSPGYVRARIGTTSIDRAEADAHVLSVELQAHHSTWH